MTDRMSHWARTNWFLLLLPLLLAIEWAVATSGDWTDPGLKEAGIVFDLCLFVPILYVICYRNQLPLRQLLLRAVALFCLGIFIASQIIPPERQLMLGRLSWLRTAGLAVLILIELRLLVAALRLVFGANASPEEVAAKTGAPPLITKLMVIEARFWKAVWSFLRRR